MIFNSLGVEYCAARMTWMVSACISALLLGVYDLLKKSALKGNAVPAVLFISVVTGALLWAPMIVWSHLDMESIPGKFFQVSRLTSLGHAQLAMKALIVGLSWIFAYGAVKHLPVSIAGPIRATAPLWTIFMAVLFMGERPGMVQWIGVILILSCFYAFTFIGRLEGIHFHRNKWVGYMVIATLLGATSALYDKYLIQSVRYSVATVQAWFSFYLVVVLFPFFLWWVTRQSRTDKFRMTWTVPAVGITLVLTDLFYFVALSDPEALISIISPIRRSSVIVSFVGATLIFKEAQFQRKLILILGLILGIALINWK